LTSFVGELAAHPEWQQRLRDEVSGLGIAADAPTSFDNLEAMKLTEMAFKKRCGSSRRCRRCRDAPFATSPSRATRSPPAPWSASIRCSPIHMPEIWPGA
jgi:hypothetical protein